MSELAEALVQVRSKIARYKGREMNEQNTKTALINPVLRALGWDVGDLEEVQQEYKRRPRDKPVDYALFILRAPHLFVEAKALGQNLDDRRWANQIMGYATVAGVEWVVVTNGDEYRIYNACARVPVEEKLFRKVTLTDEDSPTEEILSLLSKERISGNGLKALWNAHFVDRQIRSVLEGLFSADPDPSLVRLIRKRTKELSAKDVKASLRRVQAQFDFPIDPTFLPGVDRAGRRKQPGKPRSPKMLGVSLKDIIDAGLLKPPLRLFRHYKGHDLEAELLPDGTVTFQGKTYKSGSTAADFARMTVTGHRMNTNGWAFWQFRNEQGEAVELNVPRQEFLKRKFRGAR